ncbi:MAG: hypothetical protein E7K04_05250 [Helicobacter sp.]|nr:hypothetical protein [Helicobacter sp.]
MIIIGLKSVKCENFKEVSKIEDIDSGNSLVWFEEMLDRNFVLSNHCEDNALPYGVLVRNISVTKLLVYASKGAKYFILTSGRHLGDIDIEELKAFQNVANDYLLDIKILYVINNVADIDVIADARLDGAIFVNYLMKGELA